MFNQQTGPEMDNDEKISSDIVTIVTAKAGFIITSIV